MHYRVRILQIRNNNVETVKTDFIYQEAICSSSCHVDFVLNLYCSDVGKKSFRNQQHRSIMSQYLTSGRSVTVF